MDPKHTAIVKNALKKLKTSGEPHPFFYAVDGENSVLHVDLKKGEPTVFGNPAKANKFLKKKGFEELGKGAKLCAGVVAYGDGGHIFSIVVKKGASKSDLARGLKELKGAIGLKQFSLGDLPESEQNESGAEAPSSSEAQASVAPPPAAAAAAPAPQPDDLSPKKLEKITAALGGAKPGSVPHDLLLQLRAKPLGGAVNDMVMKQVEAELARREKLVSRQAALANRLTSIREGHSRLEAELASAGDPAQVLAKLQERLTKLKSLRDQFAAELR